MQDVGYPEFLNIRPYMSQSSGEPVTYGLYAVLVHSGHSCHAGHYYCYVKVRGSRRVGGGCAAVRASAAVAAAEPRFSGQWRRHAVARRGLVLLGARQQQQQVFYAFF